MLKNIILEQEYNMPEVKFYFICPLRFWDMYVCICSNSPKP